MGVPCYFIFSDYYFCKVAAKLLMFQKTFFLVSLKNLLIKVLLQSKSEVYLVAIVITMSHSFQIIIQHKCAVLTFSQFSFEKTSNCNYLKIHVTN